MITIGDYEYRDEEDIIGNFRRLLKPTSGPDFSDYSNVDINEFSGIMTWLYLNKFVIREFPNVIKHKMSLKAFGSETIRRYIMTNKPELSNVPWSERRAVVDSLTIERIYDDSSFEVKPEIESIMKDIAMGTGDFQSHSKENKLAMLNNCVEYLLKDGEKYKTVDASIFYGFLDQVKVIKFRKDTHVFRHHDRNTMFEREQWDDEKKDLYIRIGIIIVTEVFQNNNMSQ
ncbi:conserved hypothetical protein [Brochothrix thermosphacta]|uniref:hypothetical protein n=1 Tax=Brochothrix thermosphacta TaxID=2756 RepID=UPI000D7AF184|nr:hypothetical protein [Brochothrix thermosphacta]SPP27700.1 conserved hypothetical protein [Brochothrix thermosphacta]